MILFCSCNKTQQIDVLINDLEQNIERLEILTNKILQGNITEEEVYKEYMSIENNVIICLEEMEKIEDDISISQWYKLYSLIDRLEKLSY
jgi:hypothetical protein